MHRSKLLISTNVKIVVFLLNYLRNIDSSSFLDTLNYLAAPFTSMLSHDWAFVKPLLLSTPFASAIPTQSNRISISNHSNIHQNNIKITLAVAKDRTVLHCVRQELYNFQSITFDVSVRREREGERGREKVEVANVLDSNCN